MSRFFMSDKKNIITKEQCKAARGLLNWSQGDLAEKVRIRTASISDFERGATNPIRKNLEDIRATFEDFGITFEESDKEYIIKLLKNNS